MNVNCPAFFLPFFQNVTEKIGQSVEECLGTGPLGGNASGEKNRRAVADIKVHTDRKNFSAPHIQTDPNRSVCVASHKPPRQAPPDTRER
jgi:hypothetical protein